MANLTNKLISETYKSLLKTGDNLPLSGSPTLLTDGDGNSSGLTIDTAGNFKAAGKVTFGTGLEDDATQINITKFVNESDGIENNDNDTSLPTSAAVKKYVDTNVTAQDLDFEGDSGTGVVDLDSEVFQILGNGGLVTDANNNKITIDGSSLENAIVTNTGNIATNVTNIATNVAGIAGNAADIVTNEEAISENGSEIASNTVSINTNTGNITTNTGNIAANTTNIATNVTNIASNTTAITNNTSNIATNATNIATNVSNIATNVANIGTNTTNIATNTATGVTNAANIATNVTNITTNATNIATNAAAITTNETNIATNATNITSNTTAITTNAAAIITNADDITDNVNDIALNAIDIALRLKLAGGTMNGDIEMQTNALKLNGFRIINTGATAVDYDARIELFGVSASKLTIANANGQIDTSSNKFNVNANETEINGGFVGINTASVNPQDQLHVNGTIRAALSGSSGTATGWAFKGINNNGNGVSGLYYDNNSARVILKNSSNVQTVKISADTTDSYFNGGNFGIGTTTPQKKFEVQGTVRLNTLDIFSSFNSMFLSSGSGTTIYFGEPIGGNVQNISASGTIKSSTSIQSGNNTSAASAVLAGSQRYYVSRYVCLG